MNIVNPKPCKHTWRETERLPIDNGDLVNGDHRQRFDKVYRTCNRCGMCTTLVELVSGGE